MLHVIVFDKNNFKGKCRIFYSQKPSLRKKTEDNQLMPDDPITKPMRLATCTDYRQKKKGYIILIVPEAKSSNLDGNWQMKLLYLIVVANVKAEFIIH